MAFAQFHQTDPDATLHVVGTGPDKPLLKRMASELRLTSATRFYGSVSGALHRRAGAASPVVMEAMASGIPSSPRFAGPRNPLPAQSSPASSLWLRSRARTCRALVSSPARVSRPPTAT
ncbi:hypothetical protein [Acidipropionibacterium virtanenii]|uniref:hypothetical protein n=1 Tax=Acidipropionibacterium virtanenii TaxID=2057246 RepID=UPI003CCC4E5C